MKDLRAKEYHRGDVFMADLGDGLGSEQGGKRPVVILQNNTGCYFSPVVTIVPFTSTLKKPGQDILPEALFNGSCRADPDH